MADASWLPPLPRECVLAAEGVVDDAVEEVEEEWSRIGVVGLNIEELRLGVFDFGSLTVDMCVEGGGGCRFLDSYFFELRDIFFLRDLTDLEK